jgi:hypothetical protein
VDLGLLALRVVFALIPGDMRSQRRQSFTRDIGTLLKPLLCVSVCFARRAQWLKLAQDLQTFVKPGPPVWSLEVNFG